MRTPKTLAKLANHTAKRLQAQTGGVVNICDPIKRDWVLRNTDVAEVWVWLCDFTDLLTHLHSA